MATSGTVAFRPNIEEIISESFERCGIDTQTRTGYFAKSARRSLNLLFSEWANRGINYWAVSNNTLSLTSGTSNYALPPGTIDIIDAVIRENDTDQMINRVSIAEYNQIPNKTETGKPNQYMIDRQYTPQIYFWQVPDASYSMVYWAVNQLDDVTLSNQDADVPYRWTDCICAGLAAKLSLKYASDRYQLLNDVYEKSFSFASSADNDGVNLRVQPTALNLI
ncbi:hypothetical protein [Marinobacter sp.]|jgi:hypothetical protein|uniref:phage adaptor protein n=1 Tax=Marinobacter sp. TaxID=50741 RepID=UPI002353EFB6|nr:hypothetical protein [Marinobacter sp.]|tara:strand:- start:150 stop:815 length:666 start_codon:yes stop_codon:yes gene_type:complete